MAAQDVKFKVKKLKIYDLASNQVHILNWLLLKSPNLIDLQFFGPMQEFENFSRSLEIYQDLKIKKFQFDYSRDGYFQLL
jgi:hypothetical protein